MDLLGKKMEDLKLEIYEVTRGKYIDFFTQKLQATSALVENIEKVSGDLHDAKEKIENDVSKFNLLYLGLISEHMSLA